MWWLAIKWALQNAMHNATVKKSAAVGIFGSAMIISVHATVTKETDAKFAVEKAASEARWVSHAEMENVIMGNLSTTLTDMKKTMHVIDERTYFLYKREIEKNK